MQGFIVLSIPRHVSVCVRGREGGREREEREKGIEKEREAKTQSGTVVWTV